MENPEMDCGLVVDDSGESVRVYTLPMSDVKAGMQVICGASGIRVDVPPMTKAEGSFGFMESDVSSEKPQTVLVRQVADGMREAKANGSALSSRSASARRSLISSNWAASDWPARSAANRPSKINPRSE